MISRYYATGIEAEFEPGSRGSVLRNLCGITGGYIAAIHAAFSGNYKPMETMFSRVVRRTLRAYAPEPVR